MKSKNNFEENVLAWIQKKKQIEGKLSTSKKPAVPLGDEFERVREHLDYFVDSVAYLNARRTKGGIFVVRSEADVQDLLFVMLKSSFPSLIFEDPDSKGAASYAIKDLYFPMSKIVLEAKYVSHSKEVKSIEKQLHDDIMKYSGSKRCNTIIFFVYDPNFSISDRRLFVDRMSQEKGKFMRDGRQITITTIIKPM
ncbi:hypothetical protein IIA95_02260 [Patescibacteria group bacterium]|nr:hypothetical protein [Patescibacteria group bacterium]